MANQEISCLLDDIRRNVSNDLYQQCSQSFKDDTGKLLVETAEDAEKWWSRMKHQLAKGLARVVRFILYPFPSHTADSAAEAIQQSSKLASLKSDPAKETFALTDYAESQMTVVLCFGKVTLPILPKDRDVKVALRKNES